jgi:flagellar hook-associated protein 3 FlgL
MYRVTGDLMKNDVLFNLQNNMATMDRLHNNMSTGKKVRIPHEDVVSATHSMLYRTRLEEMQQYLNNINEGQERLNIADSALQSVTDILKRFEELAVQAANGTYTNEDRAKMAVEIDELLKQIVQIGNSRYKNETIFSGFRTDADAFMAVMGKPEYADREVIMEVRYMGNIGEQQREIEQGVHLAANITGNKAFWTNNQVVTSVVPNTAYTAPADSQFRVDGKVIEVKAGDNIDTIIGKINSSGAAVYATRGGNNQEEIQITTTSPHELWMEDIKGGTTLQDLGLADYRMAPNGVPSGMRRQGVSIFDMAIKLRDDLWKGNVQDIGGRDLGLIQSALDNILRYNAEVGARVNRMETVKSRLTTDQVSMKDILAKTENVDLSETVMHLKMLEYVHQSALASGARILKPSLIDFLR